MDTGSPRESDGDTITPTEARLLKDLKRITEATTRLEQTLAEAHYALVRARSPRTARPQAGPALPADEHIESE